jgi:two-component system alkaline phosphatase synthesis response regulator PhoP
MCNPSMENTKTNPFKGRKILLVEDEDSLALGLEYNLTAEGYNVTRAHDGKEALELIFDREFDLIILDIMLPYLDGFEVAAKVREKYLQIPILMLTARTTAAHRVRGLEIGADDYMTKPFHLQELLLRVQGMLRRKQWYRNSINSTPVYKFGENEINFEKLSCKTERGEIQLTAHEAMLLRYLIENKGRVVSRKELLEHIWQVHTEMETRTVDNFIMRLRKYFEADPAHPVFFKSIRGVGYLFQD